MDREEIEQRFASAGWSIDGGFAEYLVIGYFGDEMSLLSHPETRGDEVSVAHDLDQGVIGGE